MGNTTQITPPPSDLPQKLVLPVEGTKIEHARYERGGTPERLLVIFELIIGWSAGMLLNSRV